MIPFVFVHKITEEIKEVFADDMEGAEYQLQEDVSDPQNWSPPLRSSEEDPIGLINYED